MQRKNTRRARARRRSRYRLTTAGKVVFGLLAVVLIVGIFLLGRAVFSGKDNTVTNTPVPVAQATEAAVSVPTAEPVQETATEVPAADDSQQTVAPVEQSSIDQTGTQTTGGLKSATIRSIGDFVIHDAINASAKTGDGVYDFSPMISTIKDVMGNADYTVANVDGPMGGAGKRGYKGYPQFNTPPHLMLALLDAGVDMLTLANNHALDTYFDGLKAEIENCIQAGMDYVGAARTQEEHDTPTIRDINGIKVGFLNYTESLNTMDQHSDPLATVYGVNTARKADYTGDVKKMREAGADVVVAYMHWGTEYERSPDDNQKYYAKQLVSAGVDVIVGGHPHVVQPAYWMTGTMADGTQKNTLCLCSMGNFLSDQRAQYRDSGIIFQFTIQEQADGSYAIENPVYIPTYCARQGSEQSGFVYRVFASGQWLDSVPEGMDSENYTRLKQSYQEIVELMNTNPVATVSAS